MWSFIFFISLGVVLWALLLAILMRFKVCLSNRYYKTKAGGLVLILAIAQTCSVTFAQVFGQSQPHFHWLWNWIILGPCSLRVWWRAMRWCFELLSLPCKTGAIHIQIIISHWAFAELTWNKGRATFFSSLPLALASYLCELMGLLSIWRAYRINTQPHCVSAATENIYGFESSHSRWFD